MATRRSGGRGASRGLDRTGAPFFAGGELPPPESPRRRRAIHAGAVFALVVSAAYLVWRAVATLGADRWISVPLWVLEFSAVVSLALFTFALWDVDRRPLAPRLTTRPTVTVLIPTLNEPREVLIPTIAAAVALQPAHETWVLDDGGRPFVADLASRLGARYLTREERVDAKAGNLNHALSHISADFVAVLDADHVARPGFLAETLGYFADPKVAIVQTPQDFYNVESFEHDRNRSWLWPRARRVPFNEQRLFYRALQPGKNRWNAAFWCGTGAVIRVAALRDVGGVATETLTEDMHTTVRLHRRGWRTVYHNEVLAYGLAARTAAEYQAQRRRWGTGAMQILRIEHPLRRPGLSLPQRLAYASTILGWFEAWRTLGYILLPLAVIFSGANPINANALTFATVFGTTFLAQRLALALLSRGYAPQGLAVLFEFVRMQSNLAATLTILRPRARRFGVTSKEGGAERQRIRPPWLLTALLLVSIVAAVWFLLTVTGRTPVTYNLPWTAYGAAGWAAVNTVVLVAARRRVHADRFATERRAAVRVRVGGEASLDGAAGGLIDLSVGGALVWSNVVPNERALSHRLEFELGGERLTFSVDVRGVQRIAHGAALVMCQFAGEQDREIGRLARLLFTGGGARHLTASRSAA